MEREIKFRAWDDIKKEMFELKNCQVLELNYHSISKMQFIGLKDKNGKEIYEGDIVNTNNKFIYEVKYINNLYWDGGGSVHPGFFLIHPKFEKDSDSIDMDYIISFDKCEVIGNIYENMELLQ